MTDLCAKDKITMDEIETFCGAVQDMCARLTEAIEILSKVAIPNLASAFLVLAETARRTLLFERLQELYGWHNLSEFIAFHLPKWLLWKIPWAWLMEGQDND